MILLLPCAVTDLKYRQIPVVFVTVFAAVTIGFGFLKNILTLRQLLAASLPGIVILAASWLTRGKVGAGDGLMVTALGIWYGRDITAEILIPSFLLTALFGAVRLLMKKAKRGDALPYAPFLLAVCLTECAVRLIGEAAG